MSALTKRPAVLIVRDGWGANPYPEWQHANAVHLAHTPVDDELMRNYPHVQIGTSGEDVGLPDGITGNSEVGHQNIGAGRVVNQEIMRITRSIRDGSFFENRALIGAFERANRRQGVVHLMGLGSSAGVHSTLEHCYALLELAKRLDYPGDRVMIHFFSDGRDTPPTSGVSYLEDLESRLKLLGVGAVVSVVGRYYAMDRDDRWQRVERAYDLLVAGQGRPCASAREAFEHYYEHPSDPELVGDEFIEPSCVVDQEGRPVGRIRSGDSVIFFNFRGDRPRELTKAFVYDTFPCTEMDKHGEQRTIGFDRQQRLDLYFCTMTEYEDGLPVEVAFPKPPKMAGILGAHLSASKLRQFRTAETEKFPHVTFFFNDYRESPFEGEERHLVASPRDVATYDQKPEMSAYAVTEEAVRRIEQDLYDFIVINYANPDMVGHTGHLQAAIKAVAVVDECVGRITRAVLDRGGCLIITADHGNCEQMIDPATGGPHTSHTAYPVELIVVSPSFDGRRLRTGGRLSDVAPTLLDLMGLDKPKEMSGTSLFE